GGPGGVCPGRPSARQIAEGDVPHCRDGHGADRAQRGSSRGHVVSLAVAPDGRNFASSAWSRPVERKLPDGRSQHTTPNHHAVRLVELETGRLVRELDMPTPDAGPLAFSADGKLLAIGMGRGSGEVRILDVATQETVAVLSDFG